VLPDYVGASTAQRNRLSARWGWRRSWIMSDKQDGVSDTPGKGGSESSGGAYPNPHTGKDEKTDGFMGHGGQTRIDYHGTGDGATDDEVGNPNEVTK
jgi:hypothetical protein